MFLLAGGQTSLHRAISCLRQKRFQEIGRRFVEAFAKGLDGDRGWLRRSHCRELVRSRRQRVRSPALRCRQPTYRIDCNRRTLQPSRSAFPCWNNPPNTPTFVIRPTAPVAESERLRPVYPEICGQNEAVPILAMAGRHRPLCSDGIVGAIRAFLLLVDKTVVRVARK